MRLGRFVVPGAVAVLAVAAPAPAAAGFSLGVAAGEVTPTSAILWAHADRAGAVLLELAPNRGFRAGTRRLRALARRDGTARRWVRGLRPGRRYWFRFRRGRTRSALGTFVTAPPPGADATVRFAWTGQYDAQPAPGETRPFWNDFSIFRSMARERNDFTIALSGATERGSLAPGTPAQARYRANLAQPALARLRGSTASYSLWSGGDSLATFRDYFPVAWSRAHGLYRSRRFGRNLELFLLDERSFRSPPASEDGVCDNPDNIEPDTPDPAPTLPPEERERLSDALPPLAHPVGPECLARIRDADRRLLGRRQLERLARALQRSPARFKVVVHEAPLLELFVDPYDRFEGYPAERRRLIARLARVPGEVVVLSAGAGATLAGEVRPAGVLEVSVGPAGAASLRVQADAAFPGVAAFLDDEVFDAPRPHGLGLRCSALDTFSYGQVEVTSTRLKITPKGSDGRPLWTEDGRCGPFVVRPGGGR